MFKNFWKKDSFKAKSKQNKRIKVLDKSLIKQIKKNNKDYYDIYKQLNYYPFFIQ